MESLPKNILWEVSRFIHLNDLQRLSQTNRKLRNIFNSKEYWCYRLSQNGYRGDILLQYKPASLSDARWYQFTRDHDIIKDKFRIQLNLTTTQAYQRKLAEKCAGSFVDKWRSDRLILIQRVREKDYPGFLQQLAALPKSPIGTLDSSYMGQFSSVREAFVFSLLTADDVRYLRAYLAALMQNGKLRITNYACQIHRLGFVFSKDIIEILYDRQLVSLEESPLGRSITQYLADEPMLDYQPENSFRILLNLEARNIEKAATFFRYYRDDISQHLSDVNISTRLVELYQLMRLNGYSISLDARLYPENAKFTKMVPLKVRLDPVDGLYAFINHFESRLTPSLVKDVAKLGDKLDVVVYLAKKLKLTATEISPHLYVTKEKREYILKMITENTNYWDKI